MVCKKYLVVGIVLMMGWQCGMSYVPEQRLFHVFAKLAEVKNSDPLATVLEQKEANKSFTYINGPVDFQQQVLDASHEMPMIVCFCAKFDRSSQDFLQAWSAASSTKHNNFVVVDIFQNNEAAFVDNGDEQDTAARIEKHDTPNYALFSFWLKKAQNIDIVVNKDSVEYPIVLFFNKGECVKEQSGHFMGSINPYDVQKAVKNLQPEEPEAVKI